MKILIIAMSDSIHTARWISQIADQGWEIHLFPSIDCGRVHDDINNVTVHHSIYGNQRTNASGIKYRGIPCFYNPAAIIGRKFLGEFFPAYRVRQLKRTIKRIKPDIIHSMEIQAGGYLTSEAKKLSSDVFPPWIATNWGSDIYLFGRLSHHEPKIREVLASCDYYSCECERDVRLAHAFGLKGKAFPVFPNTGGFDLGKISNLRQAGPTANRRKIMLKGYQSWAGRALVGLRALERCAELVKEYEVIIYSATPDVVLAAELFQKSTDVPVTIIPANTPHNEILRLHGQSRISIGLSIGDAISTSCLEALVMGSFPIQSWTACADEWLEDGRTGILVPPDDPEVVEQAIRRALTDGELVNKAAEINYKTTMTRLDQSLIKPKAVEIYKTVAREKGINNEYS